MFGFSLNIVTLLALTLVIGILVDDAIVEIENIEKRIARGQSRYQRGAAKGPTPSAWRSWRPPSPSWWCSCLSRSCTGMPGQFFKEFGLTVAVAVLFSLVVARLLTPLLAAYFLKPAKHAHARRELPGFYPQRAGLGAGPPVPGRRSSAPVILFGSFALVKHPAHRLPAGRRRQRLPICSVQGPPGATDHRHGTQAVQWVTALMQAQPDVADRLRPGRVEHRRRLGRPGRRPARRPPSPSC